MSKKRGGDARRVDLNEAFAGKGVLFLGGTGFLGKVCFGMLLDRFPEVRRIYMMTRAPDMEASRARFHDMIVGSPAFLPLRSRHGDGLGRFLEERVVVLGGDITQDNLGYSEEQAAEIGADIDVILNCSGRVTFNPPLELALATNVRGTRNTIEMARRMKRPALVHVSTCFVAGNRSGEIFEDEPLIGFFPRRDRDDQEFSVDKEIEDCERLAARVRDEAEDKSRADAFLEQARARFAEEGRDPDDARALRVAVSRERKEWIRGRLRDLGLEKSQGWGWPNIYTYTKSLGDQLVAAADGVARTIVRPAVVESAISFPVPGWNEGLTTSAPMIRSALKGQNIFPGDPDVVLDIVPVDMVASATLAAAADALTGEPRLVHQVAAGDRNPVRVRRLVDLTGLYKRRHFRKKTTGLKIWNEILGRMEAKTVPAAEFEERALRWTRAGANTFAELLDRIADEPLGPLSPAARSIREQVDAFTEFADRGERHYQTFKPFIAGEKFTFRADNTRELFSRLDNNNGRLYFAPEEIDWYDYWLHVHLPGLEKWVFPELDSEEAPKGRRVYAYRTLNELFEACTKNHAGRVAMRIHRNDREERYTYRDLRECVLRAAVRLVGAGRGPSDHVGLIAENCPEWGMAFFAIQRIGATAVPLERDMKAEDVVKLLGLGDAGTLLISDSLFERHREAFEAAGDGRAPFDVIPFSELFALGDEEEERRAVEALPSAPPGRNAVASILFTSGTTGTPKGVMLTHRNFTSLVVRLLSVYDIGEEDGALSVLPLHHSFEFTTGFLLPLSRGAQITYLDEVTPEAIRRELQRGLTTCIVGVPALWDLLRRRILAPFADRSKRAEDLVVALIDAVHLLREDAGVNLGPALFMPVHAALGGRLRYLISGAAALSDATYKTFRGLGFNIAQGYGLTEAAPVLTVTPPDGPSPLGSVGRALPGVELRIADPDAAGVGEVVARGPNVMAGYYGNEDETGEVLRDGWLHTGDLGRLDEDGNLFLVGRRKEVIVDSGGKNIYPEDIEAKYAEPELVEEMAVVGLPLGAAEQVACVVVLKEDSPENRKRLEEHFRAASAGLPIHQRIKTIEFRSEELPRTATRKVKRSEVVRWLKGVRRQEAAKDEADARSDRRLLDIVASLAEKPPGSVRSDSTFAELGFDSLMYSELGAVLESEFGESFTPEALARMETVAELAAGIGTRSERTRRERPRRAEADQKRRAAKEIEVPPALASLGRKGLGEAQHWFYHRFMNSEFSGRGYVPQHVNFLVAANHASHLDMGLVKMALGDAGGNLVALAAADYFFDNRIKRAFFGNFTSLVPMERRGSLRESLDSAARYLQSGYSVLIFPEGTRSRSGEIAEFRRGFAHLAFRCGVGVLPMHLDTWSAYPPGSVGLRSRDVSARIGPFLSRDMLSSFVEGLRGAEAEHAVADLARALVVRLSRREPIRLEEEMAAVRAARASGGTKKNGVGDVGVSDVASSSSSRPAAAHG